MTAAVSNNGARSPVGPTQSFRNVVRAETFNYALDNGIGHLPDRFPPLHLRRTRISLAAVPRRRGRGELRNRHMHALRDGYDHRMRGAQWLAQMGVETFRPETRKLLELRA